MKLNVVIKKIFDTFSFFFLLAIVDVEVVKSTLKIEGVEHILSNVSKIIEDEIFVYIVYIDEIMLSDDEFCKKNLLFEQYI